jgi:hypothetical protein
MDDDKLMHIKCQSIYQNLLQACRGAATDYAAVDYVNELNETARCDYIYDLSKVRDAYRRRIGADAIKRIETLKETDDDARLAQRAVLHYLNWTERELLRAVDWSTWTWFHFVHKAERSVAMLTMNGGAPAALYGGWKFVQPRQGRWYAWMRQSSPRPPNLAPDPAKPGMGVAAEGTSPKV